MNSIKIFHTADWHFNCKFSGIKNQQIRRARHLDMCETFKKAVNLALDENVDLFLIAGDLFEQNSFTIETINFIIDTLSKLKCPVLISPGNHDPYINKSPYKLYDWGSHVHIFSKNQFVPFRYKNAVVYGIANTLYQDGSCCLQNFNLPSNPDTYNIVMLHGTYVNLIPFIAKTEVTFPFTQDQLKKLNAKYVALGHFHQFNDLSLQNTSIYYTGTPEGTSFTESGQRFAILAELNSSECKINKIQINRRSFIKHKFDVSGMTNQNSLYEKLREEIKKISNNENLIHISLTGTLSFSPNLQEIGNRLSSDFFYMSLENNTTPFLNLDELKNLSTLAGEFTRKLEEKKNKAGSLEEKIILDKALAYGLKALMGKEEIELE